MHLEVHYYAWRKFIWVCTACFFDPLNDSVLEVAYTGQKKLQHFKRSFFVKKLILLQQFRYRIKFQSVMCDAQELLLKDPKFNKLLLRQSRTQLLIQILFMHNNTLPYASKCENKWNFEWSIKTSNLNELDQISTRSQPKKCCPSIKNSSKNKDKRQCFTKIESF